MGEGTTNTSYICETEKREEAGGTKTTKKGRPSFLRFCHGIEYTQYIYISYHIHSYVLYEREGRVVICTYSYEKKVTREREREVQNPK